MHFTDQEQTVLRIVQNNLPDTLTPYADIAAASGLSEEQVLALLTRLKEDGTIRLTVGKETLAFPKNEVALCRLRIEF